MQRAKSLEKILKLGKTGGRKRMGQQRMTWLDGTINLMDICLSKLPEIVKGRETWHAAVHGGGKELERPSNWITVRPQMRANVLYVAFEWRKSKHFQHWRKKRLCWTHWESIVSYTVLYGQFKVFFIEILLLHNQFFFKRQSHRIYI